MSTDSFPQQQEPVAVLRIGPPSPSSTLIKTALLSYFPSSGDILLIANKYFCAQVQLVVDDSDDSSLLGRDDTKEDGVILVFDGLASNPDRSHFESSNTFTSLTSYHHDLSTKRVGDLLQLCVGVSLMDLSVQEWRGKKHEEEYSKRILWCLDREYEYLEANLSLQGQQQGHDERDKDGFARVVEAMQGTVWSSAVMEKKKHEEMKKKYEQVMRELTDDKDVAMDEQEKTTKHSSGILVGSESSDYIDHDKLVDDDEHHRRNKEKVDAEKMESFESLLRQASDLRDESKGGNLPDELRRERAADLALALISQLGLEDEDDSSEEEQEHE